MKLSRRDVLGLSGVAFCAGVAGCASYTLSGREDSRVRISDITVVNLDTESHLFDVMIRDAETDSVVFWERYTADAATEAEDGPGYAATGGTYWERPVSGPGEYVIYADADREVAANDSEWERLDVSEQGDCVGLDVGIDRNGHLYIGVKYPDSC